MNCVGEECGMLFEDRYENCGPCGQTLASGCIEYVTRAANLTQENKKKPQNYKNNNAAFASTINMPLLGGL